MKDKTIHQFSAGVRILLERIKTNPEDFLERGKFRSLANEVYSIAHLDSHREISMTSRLRMLKPEEITALHDALVEMERPSFDAWVLKELLSAPEEMELPRVDANSFNRARMAQNAYPRYDPTLDAYHSPLQGVMLTKQEEQIREDAKKLGLFQAIKAKLKTL
jgi:hypothetical protein